MKNAEGKYTTYDQIFETVPELLISPTPVITIFWMAFDQRYIYMINLSESFFKENVHAYIFEEFLSCFQKLSSRVLSEELFAEFEQRCLQISRVERAFRVQEFADAQNLHLRDTV